MIVSPAAALGSDGTGSKSTRSTQAMVCIFGGAKFNRLSLVVFELRTLSSRSGGPVLSVHYELRAVSYLVTLEGPSSSLDIAGTVPVAYYASSRNSGIGRRGASADLSGIGRGGGGPIRIKVPVGLGARTRSLRWRRM